MVLSRERIQDRAQCPRSLHSFSAAIRATATNNKHEADRVHHCNNSVALVCDWAPNKYCTGPNGGIVPDYYAETRPRKASLLFKGLAGVKLPGHLAYPCP